ncbi:hypothetical protein C8T65DRAFT_746865 [Cerioporus squamosus]|nr:hypothetical protein C8T65DRAFT_746865 [Cerioporus squamosus]
MAFSESFEIMLGRCTSVPLWATVAILPASIGHRFAAYTSAKHPHAGAPVNSPNGTAPQQPNPAPFSSPQFILPHQPPPPPNPVPFSTPQLDGSIYAPAAGPIKGSAFLTPQINVTGHSGNPQLPSGSPCSVYHISTWKNAESYCLEVQLRGRIYEDMLLENQRRDGTLANGAGGPGHSQKPSVNVSLH